MTFENILQKIRNLKLELNSIDENSSIDYIFTKSDLDKYLEYINNILEKKATDEQKEYAKECIDQVLNEANVFYAQRQNKKSPAITIKIEDEDIRADGFFKDPYITIYDGDTPKNTKNCVRVSLHNGALLNHRNTQNKGKLGHLPQNCNQLKVLPDIMKSNTNRGNYKGNVEDCIKQYLKERYADKGKQYTDDDDAMNFCDFKSFKEERSKDKLNKYVR